MKKSGEYISRIEIDALWSGRRHVVWDLQPGVNILSGVNGVGKSTILRKVVHHLICTDKMKREMDGVHLTLYPEGSEGVDFDVIRSFDRPVGSSEFMKKVTDTNLNTELDFHLYQLQRSYLDYQVNLSNRMLELFTSSAPDAHEKAALLGQEKAHFQDIVDELFAETGKKINRKSNEIEFEQIGESILPYQLSSGEKQMLIILLTVLVQNRRPCVLFMDEPEVSLHIEWQQKLITIIRDLNPHVQVILTTHSPAVIMNGWMDCVTDVEDIVDDEPLAMNS